MPNISKTHFLAIDIHKYHRILIGVIVSTDTTESDKIAQNYTALHRLCSFCPVGSIVCTELHRLGQLRQIPVNYDHVSWYFVLYLSHLVPALNSTHCAISLPVVRTHGDFPGPIAFHAFPFCQLTAPSSVTTTTLMYNQQDLNHNGSANHCYYFDVKYANNNFTKSGNPLHLSYMLTQQSLLEPLCIGNCLIFEVRLPFGPDDGLGEGS